MRRIRRAVTEGMWEGKGSPGKDRSLDKNRREGDVSRDSFRATLDSPDKLEKS